MNNYHELVAYKMIWYADAKMLLMLIFFFTLTIFSSLLYLFHCFTLIQHDTDYKQYNFVQYSNDAIDKILTIIQNVYWKALLEKLMDHYLLPVVDNHV